MKTVLQNSKLQLLLFLILNLFCAQSILSQTITSITVNPTTVCAGSTVSVTFTATSGKGTTKQFTTGTTFQPYISAVGGGATYVALPTFTNPSSSPALPASGTNDIVYSISTTVVIPSGTTPGTVYKIAMGCSGNPTINASTGTPQSGNFTVVAPAVGGTVSGSSSVCTGTNSTTLTLSGITGTVSKWQYSTFSDFSSGVVDVVNATSTLTDTNLTVTRYYRAVVINGSCSANSSTGTITVDNAPETVAALTISDADLCKYIGTTDTITFTASPVVGAVSYTWTIPAGVTIISGQGTNQLVVDLHTANTTNDKLIGFVGVKAVNALGCESPLEQVYRMFIAYPIAPLSVSLKYNNVVYGSVGNFVGDATKTLVLEASLSSTATHYSWQLPAGVNVVSGNPNFDNIISINLGGVTPGLTDLVFYVESVANCGYSSADKKLALSRKLPGRPNGIYLTDDLISTVNKITNVSTFGQRKLTLTAIPNTSLGFEATSYKWVLPSGVGIVDNSAVFVSEDSGFKTYTSISNVIYINMSGIENASTLVLKVYGVNGTGESLQSKDLTLKSLACSTIADVATVTISDTDLCKYVGTTDTITFTASPVVGAVSYFWTISPEVTIISGQGTNQLVVDLHNAIATVDKFIGFVGVKAVNAIGCESSLEQVYRMSFAYPIAPLSVSLKYNNVEYWSVGNFVGDATKTLVLEASISSTATHYSWQLPAGVNVVSGNPNFDNIISINLGGVTPGLTDLVFNVVSVSNCGNSSADKKLTLTRKLPGNPNNIYLTDDLISSTDKITYVSPYSGKLNERKLTLTATPNTTPGYEATSYKWVLPSGIGIVDNTANFVSEVSGFKTYTSVSNVISINMSGIGNATLLLLKVYGVNGTGESLLSKDLTLKSAKPSTPGALTTLSGGVPTYHPSCGTISVKVPNVLGVTYTWAVLNGALASIVSTNSDGNEITINVSQLPSILNSSFKISVTASNGTGTSATPIYTIKLGNPCSSKSISEKQEIVDIGFNPIASSNPFSEVVKIDFGSTEDGAIKTTLIRVYDILGRLIEEYKSQSDSIELASNYASGVYNIVVIQGENNKKIKVIKR